jgi:hypothetical protein
VIDQFVLSFVETGGLRKMCLAEPAFSTINDVMQTLMLTFLLPGVHQFAKVLMC